MQWARALFNSLKPARRLIGTDLEGNKYYEIVREGRKARREVVTTMKHVEYKPGTIPMEWEAWIRGKRKDPPTHDELVKKIEQAEILQKRVKQVEERERELQVKEYHEGLVARPAQKASQVGHASAPFYQHLDNVQEPTSTGSTFQPGGWTPGKSSPPGGKGQSSQIESEAEKDTFQPEAWVPPGHPHK